MRSSQKGYQRNGYILIEVFAFENGYINKKKDNYHQVQDVLLLTNVHSSMFEVRDGEYKRICVKIELIFENVNIIKKKFSWMLN